MNKRAKKQALFGIVLSIALLSNWNIRIILKLNIIVQVAGQQK